MGGQGLAEDLRIAEGRTSRSGSLTSGFEDARDHALTEAESALVKGFQIFSDLGQVPCLLGHQKDANGANLSQPQLFQPSAALALVHQSPVGLQLLREQNGFTFTGVEVLRKSSALPMIQNLDGVNPLRPEHLSFGAIDRTTTGHGLVEYLGGDVDLSEEKPEQLEATDPGEGDERRRVRNNNQAVAGGSYSATAAISSRISSSLQSR